MAPSTSSAFTDPFSAVYKARPGQLPSFFSLDSYQPDAKKVPDEDSQGHKQQSTLQDDPISNPNEKFNHCNVFSPLLAGESDRLVRKRILSNPEQLFRSCSTTSATSAVGSTLSPSKAKSPKPSVSDHDTFQEEEEEEEETTDELLSTNFESSEEKEDYEMEELTSTKIGLRDVFSNNPIERSPIPARSGIFFSPPKNLPRLNQSQLATGGHDSQHVHLAKKLKAALKSNDRNTFSAALSQAVTSGNTHIDLDNQKIRTIPDLSSLMNEQEIKIKSFPSKNAVKMTAVVEKITDASRSSGSSNRLTMARAQSAPVLSFSPNDIFRLILSNNYLNSNFSNIHRICHLQGLEVLSLRANLLTEIPNEFSNLKNLKVLNLSNNLLSFLPSSILKLRENNCKFQLSGNPWFKPSDLSDRNGRTFQWISKPKQVFYFHSNGTAPFDSTRSTIPSLIESCIRKLCITKESGPGEEIINDHPSLTVGQNKISQNLGFSNQRYPSSPSNRPILLPKTISKILSNPRKSFYRCELCQKRQILNSNNELLIDEYNEKKIDQDHQNLNDFFQFTSFYQHDNRQITSTINYPEGEDEDENPWLDNLVPIRWIACSFNCCAEHLVMN